MTSDYNELCTALVVSIKLGYEAEADDPNVSYEAPPHDEVRWLANWLISEGWTRPATWPRD